MRAARLAEKHAKMKAALAEKVARDEEEARRRQEQVELKEHHKAAVEAWKNKNKVDSLSGCALAAWRLSVRDCR